MEESTDRWMLWGIGFFVILVLAFPAYRLLEPGSRETTKEAYVNDLVVSGQQLFVDNCVACHGPDATGGIGPALNSKQFLGSASDDQIRSLISSGIPGSQMSAYLQDSGGPLTAEQINAVSSYLRSLEKNAPDRPDWRAMMSSGPVTTSAGSTTTTAGPTTSTTGAAVDGKAIYAGKCRVCHGANLEGGVGLPLGPGSDAVADSDQTLIGFITDGVAGTAMPAWGGKLSSEEIQAVLGYIRSVQNG